jgi:hypothetical protein
MSTFENLSEFEENLSEFEKLLSEVETFEEVQDSGIFQSFVEEDGELDEELENEEVEDDYNEEIEKIESEKEFNGNFI